MTERQHNRVLRRLGKLNDLVDQDRVSLRSLAVRFILAEPHSSVAVIEMKTPAGLKENLKAVDTEHLDAKTVEALKHLS